EKARQQKPLRPDEELLLGQLYQAQGDLEHALATFQRLILLEGEKPAYLVPYIRALIERRDVNSAGQYLERLAAQAPQDRHLPELRALLLKAQRSLTAKSP